MTDKTPWCCTSYASECPLCPEYGTRLVDPCPGHPADEANWEIVGPARLHAERRHPGFEYATTRGPRKQWDDADRPPADGNGDPDHTWEPNRDAGRPGMGWDRFDYHEEAYWRRLKTTDSPQEVLYGPESAQKVSGGELAGRDRDRGAQAGSGDSGPACIHPEGYDGECPCPPACPCCRAEAAARDRDMRVLADEITRLSAIVGQVRALADEHPVGIDTALIEAALDPPPPAPAATEATEPQEQP